ncbi:MAG: BTAD domain-containing putative transcriptional regulator [Chloroflexota bacterium]
MTLKLHFFGGFQAEVDAQPLHLRTDKMRALLAYLAMNPNQPYLRPKLAYLFWPDFSEQKARTNLRVAISRLRKSIAILEPTLDDALFTLTRYSVQFNPVPPQQDPEDARKSNGEALATHFGHLFWCDVIEFRTLMVECDRHDHGTACDDCFGRLARAVELYQGDLLSGLHVADSDPFETWLSLERSRYHQQVVTTLDMLMAYCEQTKNYQEMAGYARQCLTIEPWREMAHYNLMLALVSLEQWESALTQYDQCRQTLREELGAEPHEKLSDLHQRIQQQLSNRLFLHDKSHDKSPASPPIQASIQPMIEHRPTPTHIPTIEALYGRDAEQQQLTRWVQHDQKRVVALVGMGGIGKTTLAASLADEWSRSHFPSVFWHSLVNAPPLSDLLQEWLQFFSEQDVSTLPQRLDPQLALLSTYLQEQRCLLVLDNLESVMDVDTNQGQFRVGYEDYGQLLQRVAETQHQSCLLLTTRELPQVLARLQRRRARQRLPDSAVVGSLPLAGLSPADGEDFLDRWALEGDRREIEALVTRYSGNPLGLELVAETIDELYEGDIASFLAEPAGVFQDIEDVLEEQFNRLSPLETSLMFWLAVERVPISLEQLSSNLLTNEGRRDILNALNRLKRRFLVEQRQAAQNHTGQNHTGTHRQAALFYLQNVVTEYVTERLTHTVAQEVEQQRPALLINHALLKAQSPVYIRQSQRRMIIDPLSQRLLRWPGQAALAMRIEQMLTQMRASPYTAGYAPGNLVNLMRYAKLPVQELDLSGLPIRHAPPARHTI